MGVQEPKILTVIYLAFSLDVAQWMGHPIGFELTLAGLLPKASTEDFSTFHQLVIKPFK